MGSQQRIGKVETLNDNTKDDDRTKTCNMEYEKDTCQEEIVPNRGLNSSIFLVEKSTYNEKQMKGDRKINTQVKQNQNTQDGNSKSNQIVTKKDRAILHSPKSRKLVILIAAFIAVALSTGFPFYLSVLYVEWLAEFGKSNSETAVIQSFCSATFSFGGFVSGIIVTKFGPRICCIASGMFAAVEISVSFFATSITYLVISIGVFCGFTFSLAYVATVTIVGKYFQGKKKSLALAFIMCGSGFGGALLPAVFEELMEEYGWRGSMLILAGMMLNLVVIGCLFKSPSTDNKIDITKTTHNRSSLPTSDKVIKINTVGSTSENTGSSPMASSDSEKHRQNLTTNLNEAKMNLESEQEHNNKSVRHIVKYVFKNKLFVCFSFTMGVCQATMYSMYIFFVDYYKSKGLTRSDAVTFYFYMNVLSTLTRLAPGILKQLRHVSVFIFPMLSSFLGCLSAVLYTFAGPSFTLNLIAALGYGSAVGCIRISEVICVAKLVGSQNYAAGLGFSMLLCGIFRIIVGPVSGFLKDTTGDYDAYTKFIAITLFLSSLLFFIIMVYRYSVERGKKLKVKESGISGIESIRLEPKTLDTHF